MAKRKSKSDNYTSMGERRSVARRWTKAMRLSRPSGDRITAQWEAFLKGKKVILTVKNPNKNQTNKPFIKINARDYWKTKEENK